MKKEIYVIYNHRKGSTQLINAIDNIAFTSKEKAIEYIENKLTKEEIEKNRAVKRRNLASWFEFASKDIIYDIKVVDLV